MVQGLGNLTSLYENCNFLVSLIQYIKSSILNPWGIVNSEISILNFFGTNTP